MREYALLPTASNVVAGGTFTLECPVRPTYEKISFLIGGLTTAQLTNIEVQVNGRTIQRFKDWARLNALNAYHSRPVIANYLDLWFARPEMATIAEQRLTALGTLDVSTLTIKGDIAPATSPTMKAYAIRSEPQPMGLITKIREYPMSFAVSGAVEIDKIPLGNAALACIHLFKSDVTNVEIEADNAKIYQRGKTDGEHDQTQRGKTPQTALATHVDWILEGAPREAINTVGIQNFRVRPTIGSSGAMDVVVEYLDGIGGL